MIAIALHRDAHRDLFYTVELAQSAKAAGFRFCRGNCDEKYRCGRCSGGIRDFLKLPAAWWTADPAIAVRLAEHADEEALQHLQPVLYKQALSSAKDAEIAIPAPQGLAYRGFQKAGIAYVKSVFDAQTYRGALIADDMGLGKTVQALGLMNLDLSLRRVLILCPKSLLLNWMHEAERWLLESRPEPWRCYIAEVTAPVPEHANLVIVNYDKLVGRPGQVIAPSLARQKWDLIVCDEAHYLKNPKAERTKVALHGLAPTTRRRLFLTGTPIENRPIELHPILEACAPEEFPFWPYATRYCDAHEEWKGRKAGKKWVFTGHSNLGELNSRLRATIMVRRLKADVLSELPAKVRTVVELQPPDEITELLEDEAKTFERHEKGVVGAFAQSVEDLTAKVSAAFTELATVRHELGLAKVAPALDWIKDALESVPKILVFAHHLDVIAELMEGLKGYGPVKIDGGVSAPDRDLAVRLFQTDENRRVFIGQTSAAGVGLTLTAAQTVAFVESDWVPGKLSQAEDRAHRIGQLGSVNVYHLVFDKSLDARMLKLVLEKQGVQDAALDAEIKVTGGVEIAEYAHGADGKFAEQPKRVYPVATHEERVAAKKALRLLSERCDGARKKDGAGFNKMDAALGRELAAKSMPLTDGQVAVAKKMARRYQRQLPEDLKAILLAPLEADEELTDDADVVKAFGEALLSSVSKSLK